MKQFVILLGMVLVISAVLLGKRIEDLKNERPVLEIYTTENIYYIDHNRLTVNAETWDHELRFKSLEELTTFISEQTVEDARASWNAPGWSGLDYELFPDFIECIEESDFSDAECEDCYNLFILPKLK